MICLNTLPAKFQPFLIGSPTCLCPADLKEKIDSLFIQGSATQLKEHIFETKDWVLKLGRQDGLLTTPDTHLYRVRKAEKIRTYVQQNHLENAIAVPKKYLYWCEQENRFYVVAEKMALSKEVAAPKSQEMEAAFKGFYATEAGQLAAGQIKALAENAPKRSLTPDQAKALAELSILGYTDLTYNNLYFTQDGKIAIIDTEPQKRALKKKKLSNFIDSFFMVDKGFLLSMQSIAGIAKLKLYIDDQTALSNVEKVEKNHVLWRIAILITKISIVALASRLVVSIIVARVPVPAVVRVLEVSLPIIASIKVGRLVNPAIDIYNLWDLSCRGDVSTIWAHENKENF